MAGIDAYLRAIKGLESSNRYGIVGPTHPTYGRALGAYQVMEANLPEWSRKAVGREVSADEFLANPQLQDEIAKHRFQGYADKHGLDNAAAMWHSGVPLDQAKGRKDALGTRTPDYVRRVAQAASQDAGEADLAAPNAALVQGTLPAGMVVPPAPQEQPKTGFEGFMAGGPGALFGYPQKDWNAGDAMIGVGASLMARDNPKGAATLAAQLSTAKNAASKMAMRVDPKTGQAAVFDPNTGKFTTQQAFPREPDPPEEPKDPTRKFWQQNVDASNIYEGMATKFAEYRRLIAEDKMDLSILNRAKTSFAELSNENLNEKQRNAVRFALDMEKMRNDKLLEAKGVQTEGDAQRAMNSILPGMGKYNNDAALEAMDLGFQGAIKGYRQALQANDAMFRKFGDRIAPMGYEDAIKQRQSALDESEKAFAPQREAYRKRRDAAASTNGDTVNGRQSKTQTEGSGSLYEKFKQRTGTN